jgi:hypothetical protein
MLKYLIKQVNQVEQGTKVKETHRGYEYKVKGRKEITEKVIG